MSSPNGLRDLTWDGTSALARFGVMKVPFLKFQASKTEIKTEKLRPIGSSIATHRTPGVADFADVSAEMLTTTFASKLLPCFGKHAATLYEFPVTLNRRHPSIDGSYSILMDGCRIITHDDGDVSGDEKGAITKLSLSVMAVWLRGADGVWKCLAPVPTLPSSQAAMLMNF